MRNVNSRIEFWSNIVFNRSYRHMIISLNDIFFQFTVLFSAGTLMLLVFLPINHVGVKFFTTQTWFAIVCLFLGIVFRFYEYTSQARPLPLYLYLYIVVLALSLIFIYVVRKQKENLARAILWGQGIFIIGVLYVHGYLLSRHRTHGEDWYSFLQLLSTALLIGAIFTALMLCHWFFMFHKLPLKYLKRMSNLFTYSLILKIFITALVIWFWKHHFNEEFTRFTDSNTNYVFLIFRFGVGLFLPLFLAFGTEVTIKLPQNHAAIGLLYMGVILVFMGEVVGQYLTLLQQIPL